jgi:hypothetical protein
MAGIGKLIKFSHSRTSQICALSQLLMDPYYRTIEGFQVLIEKDWISFGHRFKDRCGHVEKSDQNSPIFFQFIDCVYHIWKQFPTFFEFNDEFLLFLVEQTYSCLFGNFLFNNEKESTIKLKYDYTISIWTFVNSKIDFFLNPIYDKTKTKTIVPNTSLKYLTTNTWTILNLYSESQDQTSSNFLKKFSLLKKENSDMNDRLLQENENKRNLKYEINEIENKIVNIQMNLIEKNINLSSEQWKTIFDDLLRSTKTLTLNHQEVLENTLLQHLIDNVSIKTPTKSNISFELIKISFQFHHLFYSKHLNNLITSNMKITSSQRL